MRVTNKGQLTAGAAFDRIVALKNESDAKASEAATRVRDRYGELCERVLARVPEGEQSRLTALLATLAAEPDDSDPSDSSMEVDALGRITISGPVDVLEPE